MLQYMSQDRTPLILHRSPIKVTVNRQSGGEKLKYNNRKKLQFIIVNGDSASLHTSKTAKMMKVI